MRVFLLPLFLWIFVNFAQAKKNTSKSIYVKQYVYDVQYFNMNIGSIVISHTYKDKVENKLVIQLNTKKSFSWVYKLNQSIFAKLNNDFSQLTEWKSNKEEKNKKSYEHTKIKQLSTTIIKKKLEITHFLKNSVVVKKRTIELNHPVALQTVWTLPWYLAFSHKRGKKNKSIFLLHNKQIISAKVNLLKKETSMVLGKKKNITVFAIRSLKNKSIGVKIFLFQNQGQYTVGRFDLKLKVGELKARLKSYTEEKL